MKQHTRKIDPPQLWQWPNLLGIDATIIAVSWFWLFSPETDSFPLATGSVLALSVWLTYLADRLMDVRKSKPVQPSSLRHRFTYKKRKELWRIWCFFLLLNIALALFLLSHTQLLRGSMLLLLTLGYTLLVQHFKLPYLLKEGLVAFIFTAGVIVFLDNPPAWPVLLILFLMYAGNCTLIGENERAAVLKKASTDSPHPLKLSPFLLAGAACISITIAPLLLTSLIPLSILFATRRRFINETYRILADSALLSTPLIVLIQRLLF